MGLVETLVVSLVPLLVQEAEKILGSKPDPKNHDWIMGLVSEIFTLINQYIPGWLQPSESVVKDLIAQSLEKAIQGLEK